MNILWPLLHVNLMLDNHVIVALFIKTTGVPLFNCRSSSELLLAL